MPFVLDCSMTMAWVFADESSERADALLDSLAEDSAIVPSLWAMEVANVLLAATRHGRIVREAWADLCEDLLTLPIDVDPESSERVLNAVLPLAALHDLSVYDAVYLELALRLGVPLATLDLELVAACEAAGVVTL